MSATPGSVQRAESIDVKPKITPSPRKRKAESVIKREASPIDVDMLSSGNRGSPIYIDSESTTSDEEADAQMDDGGVGETKTGQEEAEDVQMSEETENVKEEKYSSELDYEDPPKVDGVNSTSSPSTSPSTTPQMPEADDSSKAVSEELSKKSSSGTPEQPKAEPVVVPSEEPADDALQDKSREPAKEPSAQRSDSEKQDDALQAGEEPAKLDDANLEFSCIASPERSPAARAPSVHSAPSLSPSPTPDPKMAPLYAIVRPKLRKTNVPPATQPAPETRKRPFASMEPPVVQTQAPKLVPKRKEFLRIPASQPTMSITAPVRHSTGSTSTAVSQRALTIDSEDSDTGGRKRKRVKMSASPVTMFNVPTSQPKPFRRPTKHPDHWHTDGSVILSFQNTAFRLHRSRLSQQSKFFAELFHGSTGVDGGRDELKVKAWREGNMDGQPLFIVDGVSPDDFDKLLKTADNAM